MLALFINMLIRCQITYSVRKVSQGTSYGFVFALIVRKSCPCCIRVSVQGEWCFKDGGHLIMWSECGQGLLAQNIQSVCV